MMIVKLKRGYFFLGKEKGTLRQKDPVLYVSMDITLIDAQVWL